MSDIRTLPKPTTRAEWEPIQRDYVGAGSAASLINRHPFLEAVDYAVRKITGISPPTTTAMRRGLTFEHVTAMAWSEERGIAIVPSTVLYLRGPFVASVDYEPAAFDASWFVEAKTSREYVDSLPAYWCVQAIIQAWCAGRDGVHFAVFDKSMALKSFYYDATTDEAGFLLDQLVPAAERFLSFTREGKVPDDLQLNEAAVKALWPRAEQRTVELDDEALKWVAELELARDLRITCAKREQEAKNALAAILVDANAARYGEQTVLTWKNNRDAMAFSKEVFEADHPGVLEAMGDPKYRRPVPGARTMRVTKAGHEVAERMPWAAKEESW